MVPKVLALGRRLTGCPKRWAVALGAQLGVRDSRMQLLCAWLYFLGEVLIRQTGPWAVSEQVRRWWRQGSAELRPLEEKYMTTCQPSMEACQRTRVPAMISFWRYVLCLAGMSDPFDAAAVWDPHRFHRVLTYSLDTLLADCLFYWQSKVSGRCFV